MSLGVAGIGWVTPLGSGTDQTWERLLDGDEAHAEQVPGPPGTKSYHAFRVPNAALANLPAHPRLRRVSAISRFAAAAAVEALADAHLQIAGATAERTAVVFAVSNGGVVYTKRFYADIVESGAHGASPLLFPETVFNAPASHLAAILGIPGPSYTIVGDGSVGLVAMHMAEELMQNHNHLDYCLVVAAEEVDWLLCDAYARWRLLRRAPPLEVFRSPAMGTMLSEGAGAILLAREGPIRLEKTVAAGFYRNRGAAASVAARVLGELDCEISAMVASANGTFLDAAETNVVAKTAPEALFYTPKPALGEGVGASGSWQVIVATLALRSGFLPPVLHAAETDIVRVPRQKTRVAGSEIVVLSCGLGQQVSGLRLRRMG